MVRVEYKNTGLEVDNDVLDAELTSSWRDCVDDIDSMQELIEVASMEEAWEAVEGEDE